MSLNIFRFYFVFHVKIAPPLFSTNPSLKKLRSYQAPLFENLVRGSTSPVERGGAHYVIVNGQRYMVFSVLQIKVFRMAGDFFV